MATAAPASAQRADVTFFLGAAYPVYDERLTLRPPPPAIPGVDVTVAGSPEIRADGGLVFGAALAFELGIIGIEGRLDATEVGFPFVGARYDLRGAESPFTGLAGTVTLQDGRFDADRLYLLSGNVRLRTPGPIGIVASGGLSLLPDVTIRGSVPVVLTVAGIPPLPLNPRVLLEAAPGASSHRIGVNGGAGLRIGSGRAALMAEVRAFYFRDYELRLRIDGAPDVIASLLDDVNLVRFQPVIVNAQAGLVFRF